MTGNGISMRTIKVSLVALYIQGQHEMDKEERCTPYTFGAAWPWTQQ